jgi:antitoxin component of MazEF toxin-antitoxin module
LTEIEVDFVKIQPRKGGSFMVTIPNGAVRELGIKDGERVKVLVDKDRKRVIYQL